MMTPEEFARLPTFLSRRQVIEAGIPRQCIGRLIEEGSLEAVVLQKGGAASYKKASVERIVNALVEAGKGELIPRWWVRE